MDQFLKKYQGRELEDAVMYNSGDVQTFSRDFKGYIKRILPEFTLARYSLGHYYVSGFLEKDGAYVYFSYSVPRRMAIDINDTHWGKNAVLIRTAKDAKDFHGGPNQYCSLASFADGVKKVQEEAMKEKKEKEEN